MKRIFSLLLFAVICVAVHAEWIEADNSNVSVYYVNDNITKDASGYYMVWTKHVTKSNALAKERKELYRDFKNRKYLKYTHAIDLIKFDLNNNRYKIISITYYASSNAIETLNVEYASDWNYPIPESVGERIMEMVNAIIAYQETDY